MAWLTLDKAGKCLGGKWLFRELSLGLEETDRVFLSGKSGSGKSTLLRALAGLEVLDEGKRHIDQAELEFRAVAPYLHQRPAFFDGTVRHNLQIPFQWKVHREKRLPAFEPTLDALGLPRTLLDQRAPRLSGGERQAVALIRALSLGPRFLFLDEPVSAMDPELASRAERWLRDQAVGFVWITHGTESGFARWRLEGGQLHA